MRKPRIKENYRFVFTNHHMVSAGARFAGKWVWGHAYCHPDDEYNEDFGKSLASARCNAKIADLRFKRACDKYHEKILAMQRAEREFKDACDYLTRVHELKKEAQYRVYALDMERPPYAD